MDAKQKEIDSKWVKCVAEMLLEAINEHDLGIDEIKATLKEWSK